jgi:hypothetical protein
MSSYGYANDAVGPVMLNVLYSICIFVIMVLENVRKVANARNNLVSAKRKRVLEQLSATEEKERAVQIEDKIVRGTSNSKRPRRKRQKNKI